MSSSSAAAAQQLKLSSAMAMEKRVDREIESERGREVEETVASAREWRRIGRAL